MKRKETLCLGLLIITLAMFVACSSSVSSTKQKLETVTIKDKIIPWEVVLKSVVWNGANVSVSISVTNKGQQPADFPNDEAGGVRSVNFITIDSYGIIYYPEAYGFQDFDVELIYPDETRVYQATFALNPNSGNTALYVTRYTGSQKLILFDIGTPK
jgi:hypothetical protein